MDHTPKQQAGSVAAERHDETRQERRERRLVSRRARIEKHGARLLEVYANAVRKRAATRRRKQ